MRKKKLLLLSLYVITASGIVLSIYAYFWETNATVGNLATGFSIIMAFIIYILSRNDKQSNEPTIQLDFQTATKLADERLVEEIALRDKTIAILNEELARKNLPTWEQVVKDHLEKGEWKKAIESINPNADEEEVAQKYIRKAQLYIINYQFTEAEQCYKQAVVLFPSYENNCAIANFYYTLNKFTEAIEYYNHCLLLTILPEKRSDILINLGSTHYKNNAYSEAEISFNEALKIYRELAKKKSDTYLPDVAMTLNNLGVLQSNNNEHSKAKISYNEALKIRKELAEKNRETYLPQVANTLNNMGNLQRVKHEYSEAEVSYKEALKMYMEFAYKDPEAYLHNVATTLINLGNLLSDKHEYSQAEVSYKEALRVYRKLAEMNSNAYIPNVALTLTNIARLLVLKDEYAEAETAFKEALKIQRELSNKNSKAYLPDVAYTLVCLSQFHIYNKELSLKYAKEAIEICGKCNSTPFVEKQLDNAKLVIEILKNT